MTAVFFCYYQYLLDDLLNYTDDISKSLYA